MYENLRDIFDNGITDERFEELRKKLCADKPKTTRGITKKKPAKKKALKGTIIVKTNAVVELKIKDPKAFLLDPEKWEFLNATQLGQQCRMVQIPVGGSKEDRLKRLLTWRKNPAAFGKKKTPARKGSKKSK